MDISYLQTFIDNNSDYISLFKKNNFKVIHNSKHKLILIKNNYENKLSFTDETDYWKMFCRGAIINTVTNKVIALPPVKSTDTQLDDVHSDSTIEFQTLIDGTMINLFHHNNGWIISTRGDIGGYNKWSNKKSFRELFDECSHINYDDLNKKYSYSFVMRHIENRNISPISYNELYLVEVCSFDNNHICRVPHSEFPSNEYHIIDSTNDPNYFSNIFQTDVPYYSKGFTIKHGSKRYKFINPNFDLVKNLKLNLNNPQLTYLHLRQNGNLKLYLNYFPEHTELFNDYRNKVHLLSNHLYNSYKNTFINKTTEKKEIPYHLKPLIHDIHKQYLETKKPTTWNDIKDYIHSSPPKKIMFAINYSES